jgi:hypothetical protein
MKRLSGVLVVMTVLVQSVLAQKPSIVTKKGSGWQKIGETTASFKMQNESIAVLGADEFQAIKLKVVDAPLNIERLQVFYESGKMEDIDVKSQLKAGAETQSFSLKNDEGIRKVAFTYKTVPNSRGEKAQVELLGLKSGTESSSYRDEKEEAERDVKDAADRTGQEVENAAERTEADVERETREAGEDIERRSDNAGEEIEESAEKAGDSIAETTGNTAAGIADKVYEGKVGPNNETVYIDNEQRYYYIDNKGGKVYVSRLQLKDKDQK